MTVEKSTLSSLRQRNRFAILQLVKDYQPISRASLAQTLDMSRSVVSVIVDELIKDELIYESGIGESSSQGGKRPIQLRFNPTARYAVGIDIGSTKTLFVVTDLAGGIVARKKVRTPQESQRIFEQLADEAKAFLDETELPVEKILGTGIGIAGIVHPETGVLLHAPGLHIENYNIKQTFAGRVPSPITVDNDANAAVLGERWRGSAVNQPNVIMVSIGSGIGAGIVLANQLYRGAKGYAGEVGYLQFGNAISDEKVDFREYGFLDKLVSGSGISALARDWMSDYPESMLRSSEVTSEGVFAAAESGDELANRVLEVVVNYLATTISNLTVLLDPNIIILGGGVARANGLNLDLVREKVTHLTPIDCPIVLSGLGEDSGAVGAAAAALINCGYLELTNY